jgi:hypothetical protein
MFEHSTLSTLHTTIIHLVVCKYGAVSREYKKAKEEAHEFLEHAQSQHL